MQLSYDVDLLLEVLVLSFLVGVLFLGLTDYDCWKFLRLLLLSMHAYCVGRILMLRILLCFLLDGFCSRHLRILLDLRKFFLRCLRILLFRGVRGILIFFVGFDMGGL